ncbi:MAG: alpha-amylase [Lachnospiraceae bacterium]|nr:alpha-amylase [Lachnospiraceae bacterium]
MIEEKNKFEISKGRPWPLGVSLIDGGINVAAAAERSSRLSLVLIDDESGERFEIPFDETGAVGSVHSLFISGVDIDKYSYVLKNGRHEYVDPYAVWASGTENWGHHEPKGRFAASEFDWEGDSSPRIPFSDSCFYLLHVRGFTMHRSSGVKNPGTFEGLTEKLGYLQDLGITAIELLPVYDFNEVMKPHPAMNTQKPVEGAFENPHKRRINYWGFTSGQYFFPKNAYSAIGDGPLSFKRLVHELHKRGMEAVVDFYFETTDFEFIQSVLRYWVINYRVDGFRVLGNGLPFKPIVTDPYLTETKLIFDSLGDEFYREDFHAPNRNVLLLNNSFQQDNRRFLKGDADLLPSFARHLFENPKKHGYLNFLTSYNGFTMCDLVSYERKHNEANGENNADGTDYNFSWNCGQEGMSRKKSINRLRMQQMKNAFSFLFFSQGVPEILAGDEFCNSQKGNNNAYCQDNPISWLNWDDLKKNGEMHGFLKQLIQFRKKHPVLHSVSQKRFTDYLSCGFPDVSYHGEQAWAPKFDEYMRHIGVMYKGFYEKLPNGRADQDLFLIFNMHWQPHSFSLPKSEKNREWVEIMNTEEGFIKERALESDTIEVKQRSVSVLYAKKIPLKVKDGKSRESDTV